MNYYGHILKHEVKLSFGVEWVLEWILEWRFGVTLADSDKENIMLHCSG